MLQADRLLISQASTCNSQIPAKLYEYLRAKWPLCALTDATGGTFASLRTAGVDTIVPLDEPVAIAQELVRFLKLLCNGTAPIGAKESVAHRHVRAGLWNWQSASITLNSQYRFQFAGQRWQDFLSGVFSEFTIFLSDGSCHSLADDAGWRR